jgi:hypothetical protein
MVVEEKGGMKMVKRVAGDGGGGMHWLAGRQLVEGEEEGL